MFMRDFMYPSVVIANEFLRIADEKGKKLTNMQLQKLVYFAHGWYLALAGKPLLKEEVKAWTFGPVIPPLYNKLRKFANDEVTSPIPVSTDVEIPPKIKVFLESVWDAYGHMTGGEMSYLTHKFGTPWLETWNSEKFAVIPQQVIKVHFKELREKSLDN
jgi:uncharacterized phage-associated protein